MSDKTQNIIFSNNLNQLLIKNRKTQKEVADAIGVSPQTFNTWCLGIALPRMGKIQKLADYFNVSKSDLIDNPSTFKERTFSEGFIEKLSKYPPEEVERAMEIIDLYEKASPEGRASIELLLGSTPRKP